MTTKRAPLKASWLDRLNAYIPLRLQGLAAAALCLGLSLGFGYWVASDFVGAMTGLSHGAKLIEVDHQTFLVLILALPIFLLGLVFAFARPAATATPSRRKTTKQRAQEDRASRWGQWYVLYLFISILAALFSPIPQFLMINHLATERGYVHCPMPPFLRRDPDRWALPGPHGPTERCPRDRYARS